MLVLKNINFSYDKLDNDFQIKDLSLSINDGDFITILGPNGSGKSTLLNLVLGELNPSSGEILFKGKSYRQFARKEIAKRISVVPQRYYSVYPFSVYEIVMMGRTPYLNMIGFEKHSDRQKVDDALEEVGIAHLKNKSINSISGGEAQRAFIARALAQEPELILLDEPNAHLDLEHQISIFGLLKKLNTQNGVTIVLVSHDLNLAGCYGKRIILLRNGEVFMDDHKTKVLTEKNIQAEFNVKSKIIQSDENINVAVTPSN